MKVGYIGVGNMGGPMCRNLIKKSNHAVTVFDVNAAAVKTCTDLGYAREDLLSLNYVDVDPQMDFATFKRNKERLWDSGA